MEQSPISEPDAGRRPELSDALLRAGWFEGREFDTSVWEAMLLRSGFVLNDLAKRVWTELGGLTIEGSSDHPDSSSLLIDPVDACIDAPEEARSLSEFLGENCSPLGMWSVQFRTYCSESGLVFSVWPRTMWVLGKSVEEALAYVVLGGDRRDRERSAPFIGPFF
jgi:hypothetical protein